MSVDHRLCWSTPYVRKKLIEHSLSERAIFVYFLAITTFDWLQFSLIAATPSPKVEPWTLVNAWVTFGVTIAGVVYLFGRNRGGTPFMSRYFPLSVTVGWKFVVFLFALNWRIDACFADYGQTLVGWLSTACGGVVNIFMFWRIGYHLGAVARASANSDIAV